MKHTFAERIAYYCDAESITQAEICRKIEWKSGQVNPFFSGKRRPVYEFIALFIQNFPSCNPTWFLTGYSEMLIGENST